MWPPSIAIRPRNTGDMALSVSSPLARPKHAAATALAREIGGVRQDAPSVRNMAIKSPRGSTTDTLILAPIAITLAFAATRICSASASVKDAIGCPPCVCVDRTDAVRRHPFVPQRKWLALISAGDQYAIALRGGWEECRDLVVSAFLRHFLRSSRFVSQSTPLLRVGIFHQAINLPPFMIVWQILCNREAFGIYKQEAMAVFINLHLVAGTDPAAQLGFRGLVRIKITGTERLAYFFDVSSQPLHYHICDAVVRM